MFHDNMYVFHAQIRTHVVQYNNTVLCHLIIRPPWMSMSCCQLYRPATVTTLTHARTLMLLGRRRKPSPAHTQA